MSLVGTRPPTVDEWDKYELHHRARLATKPGLTRLRRFTARKQEPVVSYCTDSVTLQSVTMAGFWKADLHLDVSFFEISKEVNLLIRTASNQ